MGSIIVSIRKRHYSVLAFTLLGSALASAETSPLSYYPQGFGLEVSGYNARERGMGEAGMASVNKSGMSIPNPSRTAWNDKTSFEASAESDMDYLQDQETSNRLSSFVIPAIGLNFQTRWPLNVGLLYRQAYHRNYEFTQPLDPSAPIQQSSYSAEGGIYEVGATVAYAPLSFLSASVGYNFLLGRERSIDSRVFNANPTDSTFNGQNLAGDTVTTRSSGGYPTASMTFRQKNYSIAVSGALGTTIDRTIQRTITNMNSAEKSTDTRDLPWSASIGAAVKPRNNQTVVADFTWEAWDDSYSTILNPAYRFGAGYEYQGMGGLYEPYLRKIAYRGGLGYERLYLDNTDLMYLTLGAGLPLGKRGNLIDVALKYGHRDSSKNNLWSEDFIKLSVTLTGVGVWGQPVRKRR